MPKKAKPYHEFVLDVVGLQYRLTKDGRDLLKRILDAKGLLHCYLQHEPTNPVDPNAVMVWADDSEGRLNDVHLGYVRKESAYYLAQVLNRGVTIDCNLIAVDPLAGEGELEVKIWRDEKVSISRKNLPHKA